LDLFIARIFDGLSNGATYGLIALALVLIYKATTLINFAQGDFAMLGAFAVLVLQAEHGVPMWIALPIGMLLSALVAAGIERTLIRPFDPTNHLPLVLITLGLSLVISSFAGIVWRFDPRKFPRLFPSGAALTIGSTRLTWYTVCTFATLVGVLCLLSLMLNRTKIGLAFRAVSSNVESSQLAGIRLGPTLQFGWALAAAVGTLGACIFVADPARQLEPTVMARVLIFAAAAAALGGLDSIWGALVGGVTIGMVQSLLVQYVTFIPNEMSLAAAVAVLMIVLVVRPSGLFGTARIQRV
jgi:branched-chain amino acid transport system permease protein